MPNKLESSWLKHSKLISMRQQLQLQTGLEIDALGEQIARVQLLLSRRVLAFCLAFRRQGRASAAHWIDGDVARRALRPLCQARAALHGAHESIRAGAFSTAQQTTEGMQPDLAAALQGLNRLCKNDLCELAGFRRPPPAVEAVVQLVAVLTQRAPPGRGVAAPGPAWDTSCRPMLRDGAFLRGLLSFDHDNIPDAVLRSAQRGLASAHAGGVTLATAARCSKAAASLLAWVEGVVKCAEIGGAVALTLPLLAKEVRALSAAMARMGDGALVRTCFGAPRLLPLMRASAPRLFSWHQRGEPSPGNVLHRPAPVSELVSAASPAAATPSASGADSGAPPAVPMATASRNGRAGALAATDCESRGRGAARAAALGGRGHAQSRQLQARRGVRERASLGAHVEGHGLAPMAAPGRAGAVLLPAVRGAHPRTMPRQACRDQPPRAPRPRPLREPSLQGWN